LNVPTSSFFWVSMLIAGNPAAIAWMTVSLICPNCASRSGCLPSSVLRADCKLNPSVPFNSRATRSLSRPMPLRAQLLGETPHALRRPQEHTLGIAAQVIANQRTQRVHHSRIRLLTRPNVLASDAANRRR
jgi:hypothetical protein